MIMADPVTVGALAATALSMAAEAALKGVVGEAVKHAYQALRDKIAGWVAGDVDALAKPPASAAHQAVVAEEIDKLPADQREIVRTLAAALLAALDEREHDSPTGIDIGRIKAARVLLGAITVNEGKGFVANEVETSGDFIAGPIDVGPSQGKPPG